MYKIDMESWDGSVRTLPNDFVSERDAHNYATRKRLVGYTIVYRPTSERAK